MSDVLFTLFVILVVFCSWIILYDSNRFVVRKTIVTDRRILRNRRAVFLTDLHNKCYGKENKKLLDAIREQKPDFVLIAGDMITAVPGKSMEPGLKLIKSLAEEFPVYYGNGNHEYRIKLYPQKYGTMGEELAKQLEQMEIKLLVNEHVDLAACGITVYGAEIDKEYYKRFKTPCMDEEYLNGILGHSRGDKYTVLLAHNPDYFSEYAKWGADLVLAGHVHGGVARVPFLNRGVIAPTLRPFPKYDGGIFREGDAMMILSRGLGMHTIPIRLFNPGELWTIDFCCSTPDKE